MILSWRRRRAARGAGKGRDVTAELAIPIDFRCPISLDLMKDPVTLSTGITYDRENIEKWIESGNATCPITNTQLITTNQDPVSNHAVRKMIQDWCVENRSYGVDRIPTPRIPVSSVEVSRILAGIEGNQDGGGRCLELVAKVKDLAGESERNRRRVVASGAGRALSKTFEAISMHCQAHDSASQSSLLLGEILSALTLMLPLDEEAKSHIGSFTSLSSMVWFLKHGDLSGPRRNAILVMKDVVVVPFDQQKVLNHGLIMNIEGAVEGLVKLIRDPICTLTTKASLSIIYNILVANNNDVVTRKFVDAGLVSWLLETLVDSSERGVCERALAVLDQLCGCVEGREKACHNSLTVPVLVKKLLRVSDLATEFSVSVLWKLISKSFEKRDVVVVEALQVGAFQKLLLLLQVGCGEETKEKASELLKQLNLFRDKLECIDSMDFKHLNRPF